MSGLAELQRRLARSLTRGEGARADGEEGAIARARRGLVAKRLRAVSALLPRTRSGLGRGFRVEFARHAESYWPQGILQHVDDARAFGALLAHDPRASVRDAAHDDLLDLTLRWHWDGTGALRVRARQTPLLAVTRLAPRTLVVRGIGERAPVWRIRLPRIARSLPSRV